MDQNDQLASIAGALDDIARSLGVMSATDRPAPEITDNADAYLWDGASETLLPVPHVNRVPLALLRGVAHQRDILLENTLPSERSWTILVAWAVLTPLMAFLYFWQGEESYAQQQ